MINKVILVGNLGQDPELRYTNGGNAVASLSIATTRKWKDKDGNKQDETEWHRVVFWGKQAEFCNNYMSKGMKAYIEGRLQTKKWQDQNGNDRYTTEIIANDIQNLTPRQSDDSKSDNGFIGGTGEDVPF